MNTAKPLTGDQLQHGQESKVTNLDDAITKHVKAGMCLYVGEGASGLEYGLLRQFHKSNPQFTLASITVQGPLPLMIHFGMVKKLVTGGVADLYPYPRPNRVIQRVYGAGQMEIEVWSLCSFLQRLVAGACRLPYTVTRSLIGTTMAEDNSDSFQLADDPFGTGEKIGLVKALVPDLSLIHGWAADRYGNTIMGPCLISGDDSWGPKASTKGVVVTVEKIVSTEFIREHAHLVRIPGFMVNSVSLAPLGAHPLGMPISFKMRGLETYGEDKEFMSEQSDATRDQERMDAWATKWVLGCRNHEEYLQKLGERRISLLKDKTRPVRRRRPTSGPRQVPGVASVTDRAMMVVAAARKIEETVLRNDYRIILAGMGVTGLAVWLAYDKLKERNHDVEILVGSGMYGISPPVGGASLSDQSVLTTCRMKTDAINSYAVIVGGRYSDKCLSVMGGASVDRKGNINSTRSSPGTILVGPGGSADAANAREVMVVMSLSKERFVEKVLHVTCPGTRVRSIITDKGILERSSEDEEFSLTCHFPYSGKSLEERLEEMRRSSWDFPVSADLRHMAGPSSEELSTLDALDPERLYLR
jgi:acyl CoA:acetate/3-ketoacid CoA transferase alpha subunit/acyl CoA:acetate/3-ketoacid CoA transferase beta subunit